MGSHPTRCTFVCAATGDPCDDWAEDGDRCDTHPRRPLRSPHRPDVDEED